jgi:hypothetical protein
MLRIDAVLEYAFNLRYYKFVWHHSIFKVQPSRPESQPGVSRLKLSLKINILKVL